MAKNGGEVSRSTTLTDKGRGYLAWQKFIAANPQWIARQRRLALLAAGQQELGL